MVVVDVCVVVSGRVVERGDARLGSTPRAESSAPCARRREAHSVVSCDARSVVSCDAHSFVSCETRVLTTTTTTPTPTTTRRRRSFQFSSVQSSLFRSDSIRFVSVRFISCCRAPLVLARRVELEDELVVKLLEQVLLVDDVVLHVVLHDHRLGLALERVRLAARYLRRASARPASAPGERAPDTARDGHTSESSSRGGGLGRATILRRRTPSR